MEQQTEGMGPRLSEQESQLRSAEPDAVGDQPGEPYEPYEQRPAPGEPRVDAALARLDELAGRPVTEHRAIFEDVHRRLRDVLGELDTGPGPGPGTAAHLDHDRDATGAERRAGR
jgi:hypothetical protein